MTHMLGGFLRSLRGSLLTGTIVWVLLAVIAVALVLSGFFRQYTINSIESELNLHMNQLAAGLHVDESGYIDLEFEPYDPRMLQPFSGLYWQIDEISPTKVVDTAVLYSRSLWDQVISNSEIEESKLDGNLHTLQAAQLRPEMLAHIKTVYPVEGVAAYRLIVAIDSRALGQPVKHFNWLLFWLLGGMAFLLVLAALVQQLLSLRSLARLKLELEHVRSGTSAKLTGSYPTEIEPLVKEFNRVLNYNEEIISQARAQAGNLAHALKTPLSILSNEAEGRTDKLSMLVASQVAVARRQVEHHLARARAVAAARKPGLSTKVMPVIHSIKTVLNKIHAEKSVAMHVSCPHDNVAVSIDKQDLQEILGNVLENAFKWTNTGIWVSVFTPSVQNAMVTIKIEDNGPGLQQHRHESIFERGVRMDERKPGSGLGLSIVKDLVQTYGGTVLAYSSGHGGLGIEIKLPTVG